MPTKVELEKAKMTDNLTLSNEKKAEIRKMVDAAYAELETGYQEYLEVCHALELYPKMSFEDYCGTWLEAKGWVLND